MGILRAAPCGFSERPAVPYGVVFKTAFGGDCHADARPFDSNRSIPAFLSGISSFQRGVQEDPSCGVHGTGEGGASQGNVGLHGTRRFPRRAGCVRRDARVNASGICRCRSLQRHHRASCRAERSGAQVYVGVSVPQLCPQGIYEKHLRGSEESFPAREPREHRRLSRLVQGRLSRLFRIGSF